MLEPHLVKMGQEGLESEVRQLLMRLSECTLDKYTWDKETPPFHSVGVAGNIYSSNSRADHLTVIRQLALLRLPYSVLQGHGVCGVCYQRVSEKCPFSKP